MIPECNTCNRQSVGIHLGRSAGAESLWLHTLTHTNTYPVCRVVSFFCTEAMAVNNKIRCANCVEFRFDCCLALLPPTALPLPLQPNPIPSAFTLHIDTRRFLCASHSLSVGLGYMLHVLCCVTQLAVGFNANESVTGTMRTMHAGICDFPHFIRTRISCSRDCIGSATRAECGKTFSSVSGVSCARVHNTTQRQYFYLCQSMRGKWCDASISDCRCRMHILYRISYDLSVAHRTVTDGMSFV